VSCRPVGRLNVTSAAIAACLGLAASTPALAQQAVQWRTQDGGNGHWYRAISGSIACWTQHRLFAEEAGGHLATLTSAAENAFVATISTPEFLNIGGIQDPNACEPGCGWQWITGEPWNYTAWASGQPENFSGQFGGQDHLSWTQSGWHDASDCPPYTGSGFIIEWSADCDGNGIVDYGEILDGTFADTNANGVPDCCDAGVSCDPCPGDLNQSGTVDAEDLAYILFAWGTDGGKTPQADINDDGTVNANDLSVVLGSWGPCPN